MGYRYEMKDSEKDSWVRIKEEQIQKFKTVRIINATTENVITEGRVKDVERLWVKDTIDGVESMTLDLNIEFERPALKQETFDTVFPSTSPPWQG